MLSKSFGRILACLLLSSVLAISLLAGCSSGSGNNPGGNANVMDSLVVYGGIVSNVGCLETSIGHQGELIVFRTRVVDPQTGNDMTDSDLASVEVDLPDGEVFDASYGGHPGGGTPTDYFWSVPWEIPLTYPTGSLGYTVKAVANDGRTGTYTDFNVSSSQLTIKPYDVAYVAGKSTNITSTGFSVANIVCSQGAKVTFNNKDTVPHTIVGDGWTSGAIPAGGSYSQVFNQPGTFTFKDSANASMTGTITVNAAPTS